MKTQLSIKIKQQQTIRTHKVIKVSEYKINTQNSAALLLGNNRSPKIKIKEAISFATTKIIHLEINWNIGW